MRIVHVSDCYRPRVGGIETQVADLASHQAAAGHEVHVFTATAADAEHPDRYVEQVTAPDGVRIHRMATPVAMGLPVHPLGSRLVRQRLAQVGPAVVHVHAGLVSPFAFQGARVARALRLPLAITWHCMLDGVQRGLRLGAEMTGWSKPAAALSAVSAVAAERVARCFPGAGEVGVVPNGLDVAAWLPRAPAPDLPDAPLRLVATQRIAPRKRTAVLLDVVSQAAATLGANAVHLTVVGDGPDLERIAGRVRRDSLPIDLRGRLPRDDLAALYAAQHVFISPARLEAFGIAALEARTAGLPVIARRGTGIASFVEDGVDGLLAEDDAGLTRAVVALARQHEMRERIAAHNRRVAPQVSWEHVIAAAEGEYERARTLVRAAR